MTAEATLGDADGPREDQRIGLLIFNEVFRLALRERFKRGVEAGNLILRIPTRFPADSTVLVFHA